MRLFVSGATATLRRHLGSPYLGALVVPGAGNRVDPLLTAGVPWAADNAAFTGFDAARFCRMLGRIAGHPGCRFVACPDVVGDAAATLRRFAVWSPVIRALGLPVALVAQDGLERLAVSWDDLDALFIGGSTEWKLGPHAAAVAREAKQRGKWSHFGRCNTRKRFRHAYQLGCDSIDGSGFSRWPDQRIPLALGWLQRLHGESDDALLAAAAPDFFRGGLGDHLLARPGWTVERVSSGTGGYLVHARFRHEPVGLPGLRRACTGRHPAGRPRRQDDPCVGPSATRPPCPPGPDPQPLSLHGLRPHVRPAARRHSPGFPPDASGGKVDRGRGGAASGRRNQPPGRCERPDDPAGAPPRQHRSRAFSPGYVRPLMGGPALPGGRLRSPLSRG